MGLGYSQEGHVQQILEFRKFSNEEHNFEIPERPENRTPTDRKYMILFIVVIILLVPFLFYSIMHLEFRQIYGSDNCGNFCGFENKKDYWKCTGKNYTDKKYLLLHDLHTFFSVKVWERECVTTCPENYEPTFTLCLPEKRTDDKFRQKHIPPQAFIAYLGDIGRDIAKGWWAIVLSTIVSCLLCFGAISLFRYYVDYVVWFIVWGSVGMCVILAGIFWSLYLQCMLDPVYNHSRLMSTYQVWAWTLSILIVAVIFVIAFTIKKIKLIIQLFKESSKAIFDIPSIIFVPIWTSVALSLVLVCYIVVTVFLVFAGELTEVDRGYLEYVYNKPMIVAIVYNSIVFLWLAEFILGAQYMVTAGTVSAWFFTREKLSLNAPVWSAFTIFTRFHMGTVAIGSLIIAIVSFIRAYIRAMGRSSRSRWLVLCCLGSIEKSLRFLSKNAYIQTAMHGQPFFKSGKRAAKLIVSNACNLIAINSIGDFVLSVAQLLLIMICGGVAFLISKATGTEHYWAIVVISTIIAFFITSTFFSTFRATIDTIFICFCEDTTLNDGMARPFYMSKGLMQFIEDSKLVVPVKK